MRQESGGVAAGKRRARRTAPEIGSPVGWRALIAPWFQPIDIAALVYLRVMFGALMVWELCRYMTGGQMDSLWIQPEFHFKYLGFEWVQAPSGRGMYGLFALLILSATGIALGLWYRVCAVAFALGFTWLFLIDQAKYLNHFYLICLLGFLSALLPLHRRFSLDCLRRPVLRSDTAPAWSLWLLRAQVGIVYLYGGIAKLNEDWMHGEPVRTWLKERAASAVSSASIIEGSVWVISYGGLLFDLFIVPLLLWRRTRVFAFVLAIAFHFTNSRLFSIGIFPWLAIALTALFFEPSWPRRTAYWVRNAWIASPPIARTSGRERIDQPFAVSGIVVVFAVLFMLWQLLMPLRHLLYPGVVNWTEEGHRFSWHMMLRAKRSETQFYLFDARSNDVWKVDPLSYLTARQYDRMSGRPDMILQFAHRLAALMKSAGKEVHVHAVARSALNGRPARLLIDPDVNLAAISRNLWSANWILPLEHDHSEPKWLRLTGDNITVSN